MRDIALRGNPEHGQASGAVGMPRIIGAGFSLGGNTPASARNRPAGSRTDA